MADLRNTDFVRDDILPSYWANAIQQFLSGLSAGFRVERQSVTTVRVPAAGGRSAIAVDGKWRWRDTDVSRAVAGAAGTYDVFVVALDEDVTNVPDPFTDNTDRSFDLRIVADGTTPAVAPADPAVEIFEGPVATLVWDGAAITSFEQLRRPITGAQLETGAFSGTDLLVTRAADGTVALAIAAGAIVNADVNAAAAIAESKLALASDAVAGTASRRTLGTGAQQAAAGNDARLSDQRVPTDGSVTAAKLAVQPRVRLTKPTASDGTFNDNALELLTWSEANESYDTNGMHGPANLDRITFVTAGHYAVEANICVDNILNAGGTRELLLTDQAGAQLDGDKTPDAGGVTGERFYLKVQIQKVFAAGDFVRLQLQLTGLGFNNAIVTNSGVLSTFSAVRLGP